MRGPTVSELQADALLFLILLHGRLPVATVVLHHGPALVHQLLLTHKNIQPLVLKHFCPSNRSPVCLVTLTL